MRPHVYDAGFCATDKMKAAAYFKGYYAASKDKVRAQQAAYYAANKEKLAVIRAANREALKLSRVYKISIMRARKIIARLDARVTK